MIKGNKICKIELCPRLDFLFGFLNQSLTVLTNQGRWRFLLEVTLVRKIIEITFLLADEFHTVHVKIEDAVIWACQNLGKTGVAQL